MKYLRLSLFILLIIPGSVSSQIDDIGLWTGVTIQKQLTRRMEASVTEQLRLDHDITTINQFLTDAGVTYIITDKLRGSLNYRFTNSNQDNYYSKRHRFYIDVSWREKISFLSLVLRERIQTQYSDYNSSETGKIPEWTLRSKLTAKFDLNKKYEPYLSCEMYYLIKDVERNDGITRFRYETGINYDFNRVHSINPFLLFQHTISPPFDELIYGLMYTYSM